MSATYELIDGQFKQCQDYAQQAFSALIGHDGYIERIINEATTEAPDIDWDWIEYDWPVPDLSPDVSALRPVAPSREDLQFNALTTPVKPVLVDIQEPEIPVIPTLQAVFPAIADVVVPDATLPGDPGSAPSFEYPDLPIRPSYTLPELGALSDIVVPEMPTVDLPQFDGVEPINDLDPLQAELIYEEATYQSDVFDVMRAKLIQAFTDGGTGLDPEVEEAIWNRAKARAAREIEKAHDEAMTFWSSRGFSIPPGALQARLLEIWIEKTRSEADINDKILIQSSNLAQEFEKFYMTTGVQFEQQLRDHYHQIANRTLDAAKARVQASVDAYNARVTYYNVQLDAYKTQAAVYEAKIRGAVIELDAYKTAMEGARIRGELNAQQVSIYQAQLQAVQTVVDLYKAEMQAAAIRADIDRLKLEAFRATVEAYTAKIGAKTAEFNLYQAQIAGQESKVRLYSEQVKAYATQMDGAKTHLDAIRAKIDAFSEINKGRLQTYSSDVERYKADATVEATRVESLIKAYDSSVNAYATDIKLGELDLTAQVEAYKGRMEEAKSKAGMLLKQAEIELQAFLANRNLTMEATKAAAALLAQLAASALSAINASASGGYHLNESWDRTRAVPTTSTSYSYQYSG